MVLITRVQFKSTALGLDCERSPWLCLWEASNPHLGKLAQIREASMLLRIPLFKVKAEQVSSPHCCHSAGEIHHGSLSAA